jgi:integrase
MANLRDEWQVLGCKDGASETTHYDDRYKGLGLRCRKSGGASWTFEYRLPGSPNKRRVVYGAAGDAPPALTYNDAVIQYLHDIGGEGLGRQKKVLVDGKVKEQPDPVDPRERRLKPVAPAIGTIGEALEEYFEARLGEHARRQKGKLRGSLIGEKSKHDRKVRLTRWLGDKHGKRQLSGFRRPDVAAVLGAAEKTGTAAATQMLQRDLKSFFDFCVDREFISAAPMPRQTFGIIRKRDRFLSERELSAVLNGIASESYPMRHIYLLLLLTGLRRNEVCGARWEEIDFEAKTWTLPKERTKNRTGHVLPLSDLAVALLRDAERRRKGGYIFTNGTRIKPVQELGTGWSRTGKRSNEGAQARIVDRAEQELGAPMPSWVIHDLRRTVRTHLTKLEVRRDVAEAVMNHTPGGIVETYDRHDYQPEMREALQRWADKLKSLGLVVEPRQLPAPQKLLPAPAA